MNRLSDLLQWWNLIFSAADSGQIGAFMSKGQFTIYGDPTTMNQMMNQYTKGLGVGQWMNGLMNSGGNSTSVLPETPNTEPARNPASDHTDNMVGKKPEAKTASGFFCRRFSAPRGTRRA